MSRLNEWASYLSINFGLTIRFVESTSPHLGRGKCDGRYYHEERTVYIRQSLVGTGKGFKTLVHELGHHLFRTGKLGYRNEFTRKYFKKVPKRWILSYDKWKRSHELLVQCLALWATDWGDQHEVNKGFKDFLISLGASPPPF